MSININNSWIDEYKINEGVLFTDSIDEFNKKINFLLGPQGNSPENYKLLIKAEKLAKKHWISMWGLTEEEEMLLEAERLSEKHWKK